MNHTCVTVTCSSHLSQGLFRDYAVSFGLNYNQDVVSRSFLERRQEFSGFCLVTVLEDAVLGLEW